MPETESITKEKEIKITLGIKDYLYMEHLQITEAGTYWVRFRVDRNSEIADVQLGNYWYTSTSEETFKFINDFYGN
jgi:hypothetical protein